MSQSLILELGQRALYTVLLVSMPMLGLGMLVGLIISIFQAMTQIQEQTLTFVPKILAVMFALFFFGPWMLGVLVEFIEQLYTSIPQLLR